MAHLALYTQLCKGGIGHIKKLQWHLYQNKLEFAKVEYVAYKIAMEYQA